MSSKIKNLKCYERMEISIAYFLYNYCGMVDERLKQITHQDLKVLMTNLKRVSFDMAIANPDMVYSGQILLIKDGKNNIVPYISPFREIDNVEEIFPEEDLFIQSNSKEPKQQIIIQDLKELTNYELKLTYKISRDSHFKGKYKICRLIKRELNERGVKNSGRKRILIEKEKSKIYD